ncbi:hypothetical protein LWI29_036220 [Acer saccharum]|uniref:RNase H type-1 domain-containing protein n=1 Tax=Acer saccharum TaxID=4024 RepID=A0AA39RXI4_ACESA|nr:hypothetical protein LWI29_036220 [Acer saccharum]
MANRNSLVARVLKASYFPYVDFIDAECNSSASYIWKSLMWGKNIIVTGTRWRVGDGKTIRIYKDRWIPRPTTFRPFSPPILGDNTTVDKLFSAFGGWNVDMLKSAFCDEDTTAILSIPISHSSVQDSLQWHYEQNGSYSSKSGYRVGTAIKSEIGPSFSDELRLLCVCLWKIWSLQNAVVHDSPSSCVVDVVEWASGYVADFHNACDPIIVAPALAVVRSPIWIPPDIGLYKINCDAALNVASCLVGFGIVIRNRDSLVMASSSQKITVSFSPQVVEAEAIRRGLRLVLDTCLFPCVLDSDAEVVVRWINSGKLLNSEIGVIIMDIQNLLLQARCVLINFSPRKANQIAHVLAKNGLSCVEDMFWLEEFPPCVGYLVSTECSL